MADITRIDPFRALDRDFGNLRAVLDRLTSDGFRPSLIDEGSLDVDVYERDGKVVVEASVPGFKPGEIKVQLHEGVLAINAEHSEDTAKNEENYYRRERRYGAMSRRIALPGVVSDAPVEAELKDGVLRVEIAAPTQAQPKTIEIRTA